MANNLLFVDNKYIMISESLRAVCCLTTKICLNFTSPSGLRRQGIRFFIGSPQASDLNGMQLQDVNDKLLHSQVSGILKQKYLVPYTNSSHYATGIIYGPFGRPMITLPVKRFGARQSLSVHFLVDTGSPITYLSQQALKAIFNVQDVLSISQANLNIWGINNTINFSRGHFQGINLLGYDCLTKANMDFKCSYNPDPAKQYCELIKKS